MKTTSSDTEPSMLPEYDIDYSQSRPNRFVANPAEHGRMVVLEPDIARIFTSTEAVNQVLRALIQTMPKVPQPG